MEKYYKIFFLFFHLIPRWVGDMDLPPFYMIINYIKAQIMELHIIPDRLHPRSSQETVHNEEKQIFFLPAPTITICKGLFGGGEERKKADMYAASRKFAVFSSSGLG